MAAVWAAGPLPMITTSCTGSELFVVELAMVPRGINGILVMILLMMARLWEKRESGIKGFRNEILKKNVEKCAFVRDSSEE